MSGRVESGVLDEGDSAGVPQESFGNHFKYEAYITYCMHAHSFKAALITFLKNGITRTLHARSFCRCLI